MQAVKSYNKKVDEMERLLIDLLTLVAEKHMDDGSSREEDNRQRRSIMIAIAELA